MVAVVADQIANRSLAGPVVEHAGAAADDGVPLFIRRVRERHARRDVVRVVKITLPVVAEADVDRQVRPQPNVVLHEPADDFLEKRDVAVPRLLRERVRTPQRVVLQARERERASRVGAIVEPAPAPIGNVQAELHRLPAARPRHRVDEGEVMLGPQAVGLRAAAGERVEDDDARIGTEAGARLVLVADEQPELVEKAL